MIIKVKVKTNAGKSEVNKKEGDFVVYLKSSPENNKANLELVKLMKKFFKKDVKIVKGFKNRNKILEVK